MEKVNIDSSKRLVRNTLSLYGRMLFTMLVSLYTSRVVLEALGVEDYGIYNVVGGMVVMLSVVTSSLSSAVSRYITVEIGRGDLGEVRRVFVASLSIHLLLAAIIVVLGETVGLWFLNTHITLPPERLWAARWVYQASLVTFVLGVLTVPYNALLIARERMGAFAFIGIAEATLRLGAVLLVVYAPVRADRLVLYAILLGCVGVAIQIVYMACCRRWYAEARFGVSYDRCSWREMGAFAGWNTIGNVAGITRNHGVNILLNMFFGPVVNASRGVANTVSTMVTTFTGNFLTALSPQITKAHAAGDRSYCLSLVERGARFGVFLTLLVSLPVVLEADFLLHLWLGNAPAGAATFVRLTMVLGVIDVISNTMITLQLATGRIRTYQIVVGGLMLLNMPLSYVCLRCGLSAESTYIVAIGLSVACFVARLYMLRRMVRLDVGSFWRGVCVPVAKVIMLAVPVPVWVYMSMPEGWPRLVCVSAASLVCVSAAVIFAGCTRSERNLVFSHIFKFRIRS